MISITARRSNSHTALTHRVVLCLALGAIVALPSTNSWATVPSPRPGTPPQIAKLVAVAARIERLPSNLLPNLSEGSADNVGSYYPMTQYGCLGLSSCDFGDLASHKIVVLFGDSHAQMWLTALLPIAKKDKFRLSLVWRAGCPAATVTVWNVNSNSPYAACNGWRAAELGVVRRLKPALVLLASRNTDMTGVGNAPIPDQVWQLGLEHTIAVVRSKSTRVAVIGDVTPFTAILPDCLAAYATHVQQCSSADPNPKATNHFAAEAAAAKARGVPYINPHPWLCTSVCSAVIGNMLGYYNNNHVSATYAAFLSTAWSNALHPELP